MNKKEQGKLYKLLGENVRKYRSQLGLTQEQLADKIELTRTSVVNIERGKQNTPLHLLLTMAEVFNITLETLIPNKSDYQSNAQIDDQTFKDMKNVDKPKFEEFYEKFLKDQQR